MIPRLYVRIIKLKPDINSIPAQKPRIKFGRIKIAGQNQNGKWLEGYLRTPVRVGQPIRLMGVICNGKQIVGTYQSSAVTGIQGDIVTTYTAQYKILKVPPLDARGSLNAWK